MLTVHHQAQVLVSKPCPAGRTLSYARRPKFVAYSCGFGGSQKRNRERLLRFRPAYCGGNENRPALQETDQHGFRRFGGRNNAAFRVFRPSSPEDENVENKIETRPALQIDKSLRVLIVVVL